MNQNIVNCHDIKETRVKVTSYVVIWLQSYHHGVNKITHQIISNKENKLLILENIPWIIDEYLLKFWNLIHQTVYAQQTVIFIRSVNTYLNKLKNSQQQLEIKITVIFSSWIQYLNIILNLITSENPNKRSWLLFYHSNTSLQRMNNKINSPIRKW